MINSKKNRNAASLEKLLRSLITPFATRKPVVSDRVGLQELTPRMQCRKL